MINISVGICEIFSILFNQCFFFFFFFFISVLLNYIEIFQHVDRCDVVSSNGGRCKRDGDC